MIAEVAFALPLEKTFHYLIPLDMAASLRPGMRVVGPFGPRRRLGFVVRLVEESPIRTLKPIERMIDSAPVITGERWALAQWMSAYYGCSLGEALAAMVPSSLRLPVRSSEFGVRSELSDNPELPTPHPEHPHVLTAAQRRAHAAIGRALSSTRPHTMLLHGVTGSGKTELYLQAIEQILAQGRSAICLLPEIALTPQTVERFTARFGAEVTVWHSRLTARQRSLSWSRMLSGRSRVVIGARSAVFAPVPRLGLIILDEEHETTFKQEDAPRYHARDVAQARARLTDALVVLGSATPSIESYHAAAQSKGSLLALPERVRGRSMPAVDIIDMRRERYGRGFGPLSGRMQAALRQAVDRNEQAMLLLNRRGFARVVQCKTCGAVRRCPRCSVPLIYHAAPPTLICHYCNWRERPEDICPECRKGYLSFRGSGTERVESELHRLFPLAAIARMDRDTTRRRESHDQLYQAVKGGTVNLLVGTQMIAKGWDFPRVTLVGIVSADTALNLPDFRAGERTFDLLTQAAGRAGRGEQPGQVLIQTYCPDHYAIQAARRHDYQRFYEEEIAMRRRLRLPPFVHLVELTVVGSPQAKVEAAAQELAARLRTAARRRRITLLGPAPARVSKLRRAWRMSLVLKGGQVEPMMRLVRETLQPGRKFNGLPVIIDADPL